MSKFYAPVAGGMETTVQELTEGMTREGVHVDVLCAGLDARTRIDWTNGGNCVTRAGSWGRWLSTSMSPSLIRHARRLRDDYDVFHVHMPDPMMALALWVTRPPGRLVVHWHSDVVRQRIAMRFYRPLQSWLLQRADAIVATSEPYARSSRCLGPWAHKTRVIPIGIREGRLMPDPKAVREIQARFGGREIVFALGRQTYYKGFDVLIAAAALASDRCVFVVGGDGELLEAHRAEVRRRGLSGRVHFIGRIPDESLSSHFAAASIFCLSSTQRSEAYGVVLLEAMALGKPVIAARVEGAAASWINQEGVTGLNVPAGDAFGLAHAVNRISGDPAYAAALGHAARRRYESLFTADHMVRRMLELYEELLATHRLEPMQSHH